MSLDKGRSSSLNWFIRHPGITGLTIVFIVFFLLDFSLGLFFIPYDYSSFRIPHHFYHHGFEPNFEGLTKWGNRVIPFSTNSLGCRDDSTRTVGPKKSSTRIVFIGDSFTEGKGVTFDNSFVGIIAGSFDASRVEVLNAGVNSYSPRLYYLRTKYLLEVLNVQIDELHVFIDISDVQNEILYQNFTPLPQEKLKSTMYKVHRFLMMKSFSYNRISSQLEKDNPDYLEGFVFGDSIESLEGDDLKIGHHSRDYQFLGQWTHNKPLFELYGKRGLELAEKSMRLLVSLCRDHNVALSVTVYPWPHQVFARDLNSIHVLHWRQFCHDHGVRFINLFPAFINDTDAGKVYDTYFIEGDVHWNEAGHNKVAEVFLEAHGG